MVELSEGEWIMSKINSFIHSFGTSCPCPSSSSSTWTVQAVVGWLAGLPQFHAIFGEGQLAESDGRLPVALLHSPAAHAFYKDYQGGLAVRRQRQRYGILHWGLTAIGEA